MSSSGPATPNSDSRSGSASASRQRQLGEPPVGEPAQVVEHRLGGEALLDVVADAGLRVPPLGELAAAAAVLLHQRRHVGVGDPGEAERVEELVVQRDRGDPLLAPDHQRDPHQVVVDGVRQMIGGQPELSVAALEDHHVVAVVVGADLAADHVGEADPRAADAGGPEADHVGVARVQPGAYLVLRRVPPDRPVAVVAGERADRLLPRDARLCLLGRLEARVGLALPHQLPHVCLVDLRAGRLRVGTVRAPDGVRLVRRDAEVVEARLELCERPFLEPRLVGVLDAQQVHAAAVPGEVEVDAGGEDPADVQPAGRRRREPGDLGARRAASRAGYLAAQSAGDGRSAGKRESISSTLSMAQAYRSGRPVLTRSLAGRAASGSGRGAAGAPGSRRSARRPGREARTVAAARSRRPATRAAFAAAGRAAGSVARHARTMGASQGGQPVEVGVVGRLGPRYGRAVRGRPTASGRSRRRTRSTPSMSTSSAAFPGPAISAVLLMPTSVSTGPCASSTTLCGVTAWWARPASCSVASARARPRAIQPGCVGGSGPVSRDGRGQRRAAHQGARHPGLVAGRPGVGVDDRRDVRRRARPCREQRRRTGGGARPGRRLAAGRKP